MTLRVDDERAKQIATTVEEFRLFDAWFDYDGIEDLLADRATLLAEVERLKPYEQAIRSRHNGYHAEMRQVMPGLREPESPEAAIDELVTAAEEQADGACKHLAAEVERLRDALSLYGTHRYHCVAAGGPCICGLKELLQ